MLLTKFPRGRNEIHLIFQASTGSLVSSHISGNSGRQMLAPLEWHMPVTDFFSLFAYRNVSLER
jgi:hypothetical protein